MLVYAWPGSEANLIGSFLVGWIGGGLLMSGRFVHRGTISVWDETIAGPGRFFEGRVDLAPPPNAVQLQR